MFFSLNTLNTLYIIHTIFIVCIAMFYLGKFEFIFYSFQKRNVFVRINYFIFFF